ncbi:MAG TPA: biotin/lipoyl-containing protein [Pseudacidobacterium sp.]|jgi:pyruvate/2-oxoglutarate dehydrogenase complex dihydrolipoamide acyltransferase (E2) component|nr:biotin/lipoyl-containing protein [Pseudacidobacterium sp.]
MPFWYFFKVPSLPSEVTHQSNQVEVKKYLAEEGDPLKKGTPIILIENYWAVMVLQAAGNGVLGKTFFKSGTSVKIGDPVAIIHADGDDIPYNREYQILEIVKRKREKIH